MQKEVQCQDLFLPVSADLFLPMLIFEYYGHFL
jgi:hypothetical protein